MPCLRLSLCRAGQEATGPSRPVVLPAPCTFGAIHTAACNKFQVKGKRRARLYVRAAAGDAQVELLDDGACAALANGAVIIVGTGEGEHAEARPAAVNGGLERLPPLPPGPGKTADAGDAADDGEQPTLGAGGEEPRATSTRTSDTPAEPPASASLLHVIETSDESTAAEPGTLREGCGFARLEGNVLQELRDAIAGCDAFTESNHGDYIVFDYSTERGADLRTAFAPPEGARRGSRERHKRLLRQECRGLMLCARSGHVLARRFHKFWNVGEVQHSAAEHVLPLSDLVLTLKLDGSLVTPVLLDDTVHWATRKLLSPAVTEFANTHSAADWVGFSRYWIGKGVTPICEFCDAQQCVGVVAHRVSTLTLLGLRDNITGAYLTRQEASSSASAHGIALVPTISLGDCLPALEDERSSLQVLLDKVRAMEGVEGGVLQTSRNGTQRMFKVKSLWWLAMAAASKTAGPALASILRQRPSLSALPARAVVAACLSPAADDIEAVACTLLPAETDRERLRMFRVVLDRRLSALCSGVMSWREAAAARFMSVSQRDGRKAASSCRVSLMGMVVDQGWPQSVAVVFANFTSAGASDVREAVMQCLRGCNEQLVERFLGLKWETWLRCPVPDLDSVTTMGRSWCPDQQRSNVGPWRVAAPPSVACSTDGQGTARCEGDEWAIFCDLDGVLCDFDGGAAKLLPTVPHQQRTTRMVWSAIGRHADTFFRTLEWEAGGRELWHFVSAVRRQARHVTTTILTGLPEGAEMQQRARAGKEAWVRRELGHDVPVTCCSTSEKHLHAGANKVLIDDRANLGMAWRAAGGIFIHHTSVQSTIAQLSELFPDAAAVAHHRDTSVYIDHVCEQGECTNHTAHSATVPADARANFSAIFLDKESINRVEELYPVRHADSKLEHSHVTLSFQPRPQHLLELMEHLGNTCEIEILHEEFDERCQALSVRILSSELADLCQNEQPHVTLSCAAGTQSSYANQLLSVLQPSPAANCPARGVILRGTVGVMFETPTAADSSQLLSASLRKRLTEFAQHAEAGEKLRFRPGQLSSCERRLVHSFAEQHGMQSESSGRKEERQLTLTMMSRVSDARRPGEDGTCASDRIVQHANDLDAKRPSERKEKQRRASQLATTPRSTDLVVDPGQLSGWLLGKSMRGTQGQLTSDTHGSGLKDTHAATATGKDRLFETVDDLVCDLVAQMQRSCQEGKAGEVEEKVESPADDCLTRRSAGQDDAGNDEEDFQVDREGREEQNTDRAGQRRGPGVVIMRGLPGSGKTSVVKRLVADWQAVSAENAGAGDPIIASADMFFEAGGTLSRHAVKKAASEGGAEAVYRLAFDPTLLGDAHAHCRREFEKALGDPACPLVIVDNTNSTLAEMSFYKRKAAARGLWLAVVEVECGPRSNVAVFHARCKHSVPIEVYDTMLTKWQRDERALYLRPNFEQKARA